jgi:osmotically-inducible protein OsmY
MKPSPVPGSRVMPSRRIRPLAAFALAGTVASLSRLTVVRRVAKAASRWVQQAVNRPRGRVLRDQRNVEADDVVIADRVRSSIGSLLTELDTPRIHVMAEGSKVLLHGDIISQEARERVEEVVRRVPGVETIESFLRVGLLPGDSRPSNGHGAPGAPRHKPVAG